MNNCDLLCEIEKLSNHIECLEYEKWDVMWQNGKYKEQLKNKKDKIKKLKKQLDQQKVMWNELKEWLKEQINFDKEEIEENKEIPNLPNRHYLTIENIILDKMQELEKGEKDE